MAGGACAGALSFEMSTGSDLLLVNAGGRVRPMRTPVPWRARLPATTPCA
jgi:uncharacterized heparinase superfamily protein